MAGQTVEQYLRQKITENPGAVLAANGQCFLFRGPPNLHGYCRINYRDPSSGQVKTVTAHRAAWIAYFGVNSVGPALEVSHRCHNKTCVGIDHLSLEPSQVNHDRRHCVECHVCFGHGHYPHCLLDLKL
ncbi:hypothetical protein BaRGS_00027171 [Batillaria attramentaria]|uniref:Zinc-binding loop region of homing endonuclease domain-containing protein n=1 Tax=Batillaria attramentaria TaxID=370345 RepID=A0ABD0K296_9CAEN